MRDRHPHDALAALVDGSLRPPESEVVTEHVRNCPACAGDALDLLVTINALREAARLALPEPSEIPDLDLAAAFDDGVRRRRSPAAAPVSRPRPRRASRGARVSVAVASVLLLGAAVGLTVRSHQPPPAGHALRSPERAGATSVSLDPLPDAALSADVTASATMRGLGESQQMLVRVLGLTPAGPGSYYEVWLLNTRTGRTLPLGVLPAAGQASYPLPQSDVAGFDAVDISRQERTGTGAHSGDSVLRGSLT